MEANIAAWGMEWVESRTYKGPFSRMSLARITWLLVTSLAKCAVKLRRPLLTKGCPDPMSSMAASWMRLSRSIALDDLASRSSMRAKVELMTLGEDPIAS